MIYSIPYIIFIVVLGILALINGTAEDTSVKRKTSVAAFLIVLFFLGFRGFLSTDWVSYYPFFDKCDLNYIKDYTVTSGKYEPGFSLFALLCKSLFNDYHFFVFVHTLVNLLLLLNFLRKRTLNIPLGLVLFMVFEGLILSINLMRNSTAILIFCNALTYIEQRRPLPYFALCLLAMTFHLTAVIYLPMYFILRIRINKYIYLAVFLIFNAIFILDIPIVMRLLSSLGLVNEMTTGKVEAYTELFDESTKLSIGYLERLFTGIIVFCYFDKLRELRKENVIFINSLLMVFVFALGFSEFLIMSRRLANLFIYSYWILWIDLIRCFFYEGNRKLYIAFVSLYCVLRIIGTSNNILMDYDNVLFGAKSYQERLYIFNRNTD